MDRGRWRERGLTFGSVAEDYERYRLGYPDEILDRIRDHATRPVRTAVEIGAGTGKATRLFAEAGIAVTAIEPDPAMLDQLTEHVRGPVTPVLGTFEDATVTGPVDLVYAAAALHWTDPATRWERIAALLSPGGVVASFGGPRDLADERLREQVRLAQAPFVTEDDVVIPDHAPTAAPLRWPGTELLESPHFTDVVESVIERRTVMSADDYVGHIATVSAYLVLPDDDRAEVLALIRAVLPEEVEVVADLTLHLARRR